MGRTLEKFKVKLSRELQHERTGELSRDDLVNVNLLAPVRFFFPAPTLKICLEMLI